MTTTVISSDLITIDFTKEVEGIIEHKVVRIQGKSIDILIVPSEEGIILQSSIKSQKLTIREALENSLLIVNI